MRRIATQISLLMWGAVLALLLVSCAGSAPADDGPAPGGSAPEGGAPNVVASDTVDHLELTYATQFDIARLSDGTYLLTIGDADHYLLVPKGVNPKGASTNPDDVTTLPIPIDGLYLAASSAMDFLRQLDALDSVRMTSTKAQDWSLDEVVAALEDGSMRYVGKYSAPDYELVLTEGAQAAIESTMIYHAPEVAERLRDLGIPVLVERSSYETNPLGRLEWIKLYGLLTGRLDEAEQFFEDQVAAVEATADRDSTMGTASDATPRVAFFSMGANGHVVVRKPGDYVSQMISLAGGRYFLEGAETSPEEKNALSTMNMEMEGFFAAAHDCDYVIYNSAIDDELESIDDLVAKDARLADLAAVKEGRVWCTGKDLFQQPTSLAQMVVEMGQIFDGTARKGSLKHLYQVDWEDQR